MRALMAVWYSCENRAIINIHQILTFCGVMSYSTDACSPLRIRFSEIVSRSLAASIESIILVKEASTSGGTRHRSVILGYIDGLV